MQLLIAHRNAATRLVLKRLATLRYDDLDVVECDEGHEALELVLAPDAPGLVVLDWDLPGLDGLELCRLACQFHEGSPPYVILLAGETHDVAAGLDAGACDCVRVDADADELRARIEAGRRIAALVSRPHSAAATLVAERSPFDEDDDEPVRSGHFELASVLVAE